jgi:uncharacterized DUF497 family protein
MKFTCNPVKSETNIRERGLPLLAAQAMFFGGMLVREDTRKTYSERRFIGYHTMEGRLMVVVFCVPTADHVHVIFFRKANRRGQAKFKDQTL